MVRQVGPLDQVTFLKQILYCKLTNILFVSLFWYGIVDRSNKSAWHCLDNFFD
jgi:hypothetical protein